MPKKITLRETPVGALEFDTRNANRGNERGAAMLKDSLERYGAGRSILLDRNGRVIAGNKTLENAKALGFDNVVIVPSDGKQLIAVQRTDVDLDSKTGRELAIADNRIAEANLEWDAEQIRALMPEIDVSQFWTEAELAAVLGEAESTLLGDEDDVPDAPAVPVTKLGDLYALGDHRLLCGDSTRPADVQRLMDGHKAALMNTDPPYGVALRLEDNHEASNAAKGISTTYRHFEQIMGDNLDGEKLQEFLEATFRNALTVLDHHAAWYLWHAQLTQGFFAAAAAAAAQLLVHRQIIWIKPHFVFGRGDYHWQHELCFYGWVRGHRPEFYGERNQSSVWMLDEGGGSIRKEQHHPTQKPVELFSRPLLNHTLVGQICYEPFAGSGSQFIAAEKHGRRCFGMELDPRYCDVIVNRWQAATGRKAELLP